MFRLSYFLHQVAIQRAEFKAELFAAELFTDFYEAHERELMTGLDFAEAAATLALEKAPEAAHLLQKRVRGIHIQKRYL